MSKYGRPALLVLAAVAFAASVASLYVHYQLIADPTYVSFCDVSETVSCEAVYKSAYGTVFGVPVAAGGVDLVGAGAAAGRLRHAARRAARRRAARPATSSCCRSSGWPASSISPTPRSSCCRRRVRCAWRCTCRWSASSSCRAPSRREARRRSCRASARTSRGLVASPTAMGLGAAWLLGSIALVALFPREPIRAAGERRGRRGGADRDARSGAARANGTSGSTRSRACPRWRRCRRPA